MTTQSQVDTLWFTFSQLLFRPLRAICLLMMSPPPKKSVTADVADNMASPLRPLVKEVKKALPSRGNAEPVWDQLEAPSQSQTRKSSISLKREHWWAIFFLLLLKRWKNRRKVPQGTKREKQLREPESWWHSDNRGKTAMIYDIMSARLYRPPLYGWSLHRIMSARVWRAKLPTLKPVSHLLQTFAYDLIQAMRKVIIDICSFLFRPKFVFSIWRREKKNKKRPEDDQSYLSIWKQHFELWHHVILINELWSGWKCGFVIL